MRVWENRPSGGERGKEGGGARGGGGGGIAYSLCGPSGNGYNMYKAYQWLKSVEKSRPVIYSDTDGEWNSDL